MPNLHKTLFGKKILELTCSKIELFKVTHSRKVSFIKGNQYK